MYLVFCIDIHVVQLYDIFRFGICNDSDQNHPKLHDFQLDRTMVCRNLYQKSY